MNKLEFEIIALIQTINDENNDENREIVRIKQIYKDKDESEYYKVEYIVKETFGEMQITRWFHKWKIENMPLWAILYHEKFGKAKLTKPIYDWITYHIWYNHIYKWIIYRENDYSWKEILLGYADRKENKWQLQATNQLLKRIGGVK